MIFLHSLLLAILLPILCLGPGFFFVRRSKWDHSEKLCASIGLSIVLIYLAATAVYLMNMNWNWCWLTTIIGAILTIAAHKTS